MSMDFSAFAPITTKKKEIDTSAFSKLGESEMDFSAFDAFREQPKKPSAPLRGEYKLPGGDWMSGQIPGQLLPNPLQEKMAEKQVTGQMRRLQMSYKLPGRGPEPNLISRLASEQLPLATNPVLKKVLEEQANKRQSEWTPPPKSTEEIEKEKLQSRVKEILEDKETHPISIPLGVRPEEYREEHKHDWRDTEVAKAITAYARAKDKRKRMMLAFGKHGLPEPPEDYKEPTSFYGAMWEGLKRGKEELLDVGLWNSLESSARLMGLSPSVIDWAARKGDEQLIDFMRKPELLPGKDELLLTKGGWKDPRVVGRTIGSALSFTGSAIAVSVAGGLIGGAVGGPAGIATGAMLGGYTAVAALEQGNAYRSMIDAGMTPDDASLASAVYGVISSIIENSFGISPARVGKTILVSSFQKTLLKELMTKPGMTLLKTALTEGTEEVAQQFAENLLTKWKVENRGLFEGDMFEQFVGGFIGGGALGLLGGGVMMVKPGFTIEDVSGKKQFDSLSVEERRDLAMDMVPTDLTSSKAATTKVISVLKKNNIDFSPLMVEDRVHDVIGIMKEMEGKREGGPIGVERTEYFVNAMENSILGERQEGQIGVKQPVPAEKGIMYHGTTIQNANKIAKEGFKTQKATHGLPVLGEGVYITPSKEEAGTFGKNVLSTTIKPGTKILKQTGQEYTDMFNKFMKEGAKAEGDYDIPGAIKKYVESQGYDGLEVEGYGSKGETYISVYDPSNVEITKQAPVVKAEVEPTPKAKEPIPVEVGRRTLKKKRREEEVVSSKGEAMFKETKLPRELAGAKPRYGFGQKLFTLSFNSDIDKALYIVAQTKKSKADEKYMDFLRKVFSDNTDEQIRTKGSTVRSAIKELARESEPGNLVIEKVDQPTIQDEIVFKDELLLFKPKGWEEEMMVERWEEALKEGEFYPRTGERNYIGDVLDGSLKLKLEKDYFTSKGIKADAKDTLGGLYTFVFRKDGTMAIDEMADGLGMEADEALEAIRNAFDKKKELLTLIKEHGKIAKKMIEGVIIDQSQAYTTDQIQLFNKIAKLPNQNADAIREGSYGAEFDRATEIIAEAQKRDVGDEEALEIIRNMPDIEDVKKATGVRNTPEVIALPNDLKEKITFFDRPPAKRTPIAFSLLGNKKTTVPLISGVFDQWVKDGVETIVEPWSGAFTIPTFALRDAIESGLKRFDANVFDKEKYIIVKAIQDGKIGEVRKAVDKTLVKFNQTLRKHAESDPLVKKTFDGFFKEHPGNWIGSMEWGQYVNKGKFNSLNTKAQNLKDEFLSFRDVFRDSAYELFDEEVTGLDSAVMNSFVKRIGKYGKKSQDMISDQGGFRIKHGVIFGKWGMISGFEAMNDLFKLADKKNVEINLHSEDSEVLVKRFKDLDPNKTGWFLDPPYVNEAQRVYGQEKGTVMKEEGEEENLETAAGLDKFTSGKKLYQSHKIIFDMHNEGARTAWTNDQDEEYFRTMMDKLDGVDPTGLFGYRELKIPTSLVADQKTAGAVEDFLKTETPLTGFREEEYLEYRLGKFHGYTSKFIDSLVNKGIKREKAEQLRIEGRYLKDLVKVKREKTGEISAVISQRALDYIKKHYNDKGIDEKWIKRMSVQNIKAEMGDIIQGYETGARFFRRLSTANPDGTTDGMKNLVFDPIRQGERLAAKRMNRLRKIELKSVRKLNKKQAEQLFMYTASKQPEYVTGAVSVAWSKLDPKVRRAYTDIRAVTKKYYPEVKAVSRLRGREIGEVENYTPLYTRSDIKIMDQGLFDWTRKDPYFGSIKARAKHVRVEMYEQDYRKVIDNWITGLSRYIDIGKRTVAVKYLIDSEEFRAITGEKIHQRIREWYRHIVNPPKVEGAWKGMRILRNLQATAILGLKDSVVLKQFINLIDFWVVTETGKLGKGGASVMRKSQLAKIAKSSGSVLERSAGITIQDLRFVLVRWLRKPTEATDRLTAKIGMVGMLDQMIARHISEGKKMTSKDLKNMTRLAEDIVDSVMGAMARSEHPKYFRTELGKNINMFYSQLNSKMQFYVSDVFAKKYPVLKEMSGSNVRLFARAITALIISGYVEFMINRLTFGDDPEEISKETLRAIVGNFPLLGSAAFALQTGQPYSPMPILSNVIKLMENIANGNVGDAVWVGTSFFGMPQQVKRVYQGVSAVRGGKVESRQGTTLFEI